MTHAEKFLTIWMENFTKHNEGFLDSILDDDVSFHSPVIFKPLPGKDLTKLYLMAASESFSLNQFKYIREIVGTNHLCLEFETMMDDVVVNGVDLITINEDGKVIDFKVMIRTSKGLHKVQEKMMESLESLKGND